MWWLKNIMECNRVYITQKMWHSIWTILMEKGLFYNADKINKELEKLLLHFGWMRFYLGSLQQVALFLYSIVQSFLWSKVDPAESFMEAGFFFLVRKQQHTHCHWNWCPNSKQYAETLRHMKWLQIWPMYDSVLNYWRQHVNDWGNSFSWH